MRSKVSERRLEKIKYVLSSRQFDLTLVFENIHDPHNVSAILRTCDAIGINKVHLVYTIEKFPKLGKKSSASAIKWVEREKHIDIQSCFQKLRNDNFKIYASAISVDSINLYDIDFTEKIAIVFGNEHRGLSKEALEKADRKFIIPMKGMVQSLNVSVAAAIVLYEAFRQRLNKGLYNKTSLSKEEFEIMIDKWCKK
jgi:tRNA (guanosine-2'-O-)-methyltransferase